MAEPVQDIKVIPAGGRFKVRYTRGGQHYEEPLESALEELNALLAFGPDVKLQQTDIRLVALNRRTYTTLDEIHNLHYVQASDIERFILGFLAAPTGASTRPASAASATARQAELVALKVARGKSGAHLGLTFLLSDGTQDEQHVLTSGTIRALREGGAFDPRHDIHMSPTHDLLMAYRKDAPDRKPVETLSITMDGNIQEAERQELARRVEGFLNRYLRPAVRRPVEPLPSLTNATTASPAPTTVSVRPAQPSEPVTPQQPRDVQPVQAPSAAPPLGLLPAPTALPSPAPASPANFTRELFRQTAQATSEARNMAAFAALELCLGVMLRIRASFVEDSYELLSLTGEEAMGPRFNGFVLTNHHNLAICRNEMTLRCGLDHTFLENGKTGDFWRFPAPAFLGLGCEWEAAAEKPPVFTFLMMEAFLKVLPAGLRLALKTSGILFDGIETFSEDARGRELIWPSSNEDTLFYRTALGIRQAFRDAAGTDLFPITHSVIKMNPGQTGLTGFRRTPRHGIIYQADDEFFARFDPDQTEIAAADYTFPGPAGLVGFALDGQMKMCALYDPARADPGFAPPANKLLHFVAVSDFDRLSREDPGLVCLGAPPVLPKPQPGSSSGSQD